MLDSDYLLQVEDIDVAFWGLYMWPVCIISVAYNSFYWCHIEVSNIKLIVLILHMGFCLVKVFKLWGKDKRGIAWIIEMSDIKQQNIWLPKWPCALCKSYLLMESLLQHLKLILVVSPAIFFCFSLFKFCNSYFPVENGSRFLCPRELSCCYKHLTIICWNHLLVENLQAF